MNYETLWSNVIVGLLSSGEELQTTTGLLK